MTESQGRPSSAVERWMASFHPLSPDGLGLFRIFYATWLVMFGVPSFAWIEQAPSSLYDPPRISLAALFSDFPPAWVLQGLDWGCAVLVVLLLVGFRTRPVSVLLFVLHLVGNHFKYSFGKIDHDIIRVLLPLVMSFSGWGDRFSLDAWLRQKKGEPPATTGAVWPVPVLAVLLTFGYFTAGFPKLLGWVDFSLDTSGARGWAVRGFYQNGRDALLLPFMARLEAPLVWEFLDYTAVLFELSFLAMLRWPSRFRLVLVAACLFHLANIFMYNISFMRLASVYLLFFDWNGLARRVRRSPTASRLLGQLTRPGGLVALLLLYLPAYGLLRRADGDVFVALYEVGDWMTPALRLLVDAAVLGAAALALALSGNAEESTEFASGAAEPARAA